VSAGERFNPDMLRLARDARKLTQADLANGSGVTQALISKLEHGLITEPSDEVVTALSGTLRFPPAFFRQQGRAVGFPHFHYRRRAKMGAKELARIEAIINIRRQHLLKLLRSYEQPVQKPIPQVDLDAAGTTPEKVAAQMRAYWLLPRGPVDDLIGVIEGGGGIVISTNFDTALLDGVSFRSEGLPPLFFMNNGMPGDRFRFSLAHELGHMVLHAVPADDGEMEDQAHRFAAEFLMPAADIRPYLKDAKISAFARMKKFWKVSIKALIKRAYDLKMITDHQYKMLCIQYNKAFKAGEPGDVPIETPSRLNAVVRYHIEHLGYTIADLSRLLCAREEDVSRAYFGRPHLQLVNSS
jgi:Zn-dependent peptidase ImmA (M78 family)/transcriptional regulator with XRE-family HTH domain